MTKISIWWDNFKSTTPFKIFNELSFWAMIMVGYEIISGLITIRDTMINCFGFGLFLVWLTFIINKLNNYYKQLKNKIK